jgi:hypothetical protein
MTFEEVFMALFDGQADDQHPSYALAKAIRKLAIGRKPLDEWTGAFEEFGLPLTALRAPVREVACERPPGTARQMMPDCD